MEVRFGLNKGRRFRDVSSLTRWLHGSRGTGRILRGATDNLLQPTIKTKVRTRPVGGLSYTREIPDLGVWKRPGPDRSSEVDSDSEQ